MPAEATILIGDGFGEGETAGKEGRVDAEEARSLGAVEVEATGVVSFVDAEGNNSDTGEVRGVETEEVAAGLGVEVVENRQGGIPEQGEAAGAGGTFCGVRIGVEAEDADGDDDEGAAGEEGDSGEASAPAAGARANDE